MAEHRNLLSDLPQELFQMVITYLPTRDLSALSRTSRHHRALVEPTVYRQIWWDAKDVRNHHPPVHLLLRTILSRPELAYYIKCLALCCRKPCTKYGFRSIWMHDKLDFSGAEMERTTSLIRSLHFVAEDYWISALKRGEADIFVALLILLSKNLLRLHLGDDYRAATTFIDAALEKARAWNSLPAIRHIHWYRNDIRSREDIVWHDRFKCLDD